MESKDGLTVLIVIQIVMILVGIVAYKSAKENTQKEAVQNGCASYNQNGEFVWIRK